MLIENIFKLLITQLFQPVLLHYFDFVGRRAHGILHGWGMEKLCKCNQWTNGHKSASDRCWSVWYVVLKRNDGGPVSLSPSKDGI